MIDITDTIPWSDVCFIDCETRSRETENPAHSDVTQTSTRVYAANAWPIVITWAFDTTGKVKRWENPDVTKPPTTDMLPPELLEWDGYFAAWNSAFDRAILDQHIDAGIDGWLDMMAHAAYNNLPLNLDGAAKAVGAGGKVQAGKSLIKKFCSPNGALPQDEPEAWDRFLNYADVDVEQMQEVAMSSLPVPFAVWEELWASEAINDRGLPIDVAMARGGAALAAEYGEQTNERVSEYTDGELYSVRQYVKQREWVWDKVKGNPFVAEHMIKAQRTHPETGETEYKLKMDRPRITKLIAALNTVDEKHGLTDGEFAALQFLEEREYGASAAPAKFAKMLDMVRPDGTLPNQYVFSGATQTGRYSSKGVQVHNMTRSTVGDLDTEENACLDLIDGIDLKTFEARYGNAGKALSRLIRPTIVAPEDRTFVWGDWSNIEARALPWLACATERLKVFEDIDADPENTPDVYIQSAAGMYHEDMHELFRGHKAKEAHAKSQRQKGKIAELALGFSGGPGALQSMAANYGMVFEAAEAQDIVDRWRRANAWAEKFWDDAWAAFLAAYENPGENFTAGRLTFQGLDMGQRWVIMFLPDGRPIMYRNVRSKSVPVYDEFEEDKLIGRETKLAFDAGGNEGTKYLWRGLVIENATQGICASILRRALVTCEKPGLDFMPVVAHTHDEVVTMPRKTDTDAAKARLAEVMMSKAEWMEGLPLGVDIETNGWYSKAVED